MVVVQLNLDLYSVFTVCCSLLPLYSFFVAAFVLDSEIYVGLEVALEFICVENAEHQNGKLKYCRPSPFHIFISS